MTREMEQRSARKLCVHLPKLLVETYSMIQQAFGEGAASCTTTYTWWKRLKDERELLDGDEGHCGRPATAVHDENVAKARVSPFELSQKS